MDSETLLACSTFPEIETARRIAQQLVTENLAACANIIPAVESIYRWQGKIENAQETLVFFKTTAGRYDAFQEKLKSPASLRRAGNHLPAHRGWPAGVSEVGE